MIVSNWLYQNNFSIFSTLFSDYHDVTYNNKNLARKILKKLIVSYESEKFFYRIHVPFELEFKRYSLYLNNRQYHYDVYLYVLP